MSIYRLMREERVQTATPAKPALRATLTYAQKTGMNQPMSPQHVADTLTKYLPTEVIALYTSILPFLVPKDIALNQQDYTSRWLVAGIVALIAVIYAIGIYRQDRRVIHKSFEWHVALGKSAVVLIAYSAWVCLVPGSPFNSFDWYTPSTGAVIGLLTGGILGALAVVFES